MNAKMLIHLELTEKEAMDIQAEIAARGLDDGTALSLLHEIIEEATGTSGYDLINASDDDPIAVGGSNGDDDDDDSYPQRRKGDQ